MIAKLAKIAESQVGVRESGTNSGGSIRKYQEATSLDPGAWPWCAAFVDWCIAEWLKDDEVIAWLGLKVRTPEAWRPKTALAYGFLGWAKDRPNTTEVLMPSAKAQAGDIVMYTFSHVGIVLSDNGKTLQTVEGNTNGEGSREGDGVYFKTRAKSLVRRYVRITPSLRA
ncbi:MAG: CHAP domain-containing protein [Chthoniobacterales bacterium]